MSGARHCSACGEWLGKNNVTGLCARCYDDHSGIGFRRAWRQITLVAHAIERQRRPTVPAIQVRICSRFDITADELLSSCRKRRIARPRQVAMYLSRELTRRSLPQIGRAFGGRDHTTVMHACRTIERLRGEDAEIGAAVEEITAALTEREARP